ncbi:glycosyltransferase family 4 protein [Mesonia sp. K4-1]|nr:glycosyltransferase family 4 protein [Mesonia sp. K4-1]
MNGHKNQKKYIFISTSRPGNARPDYFFNLANSFVNRNYKVVMLIDKNSLVKFDNPNISCINWPSRRPTSLKDFFFICKKITKYKPTILISSFGSVNLMNIAGSLLMVKNRINYLLSVVELFGSSNSGKEKVLKWRKRYIYNMASLFVANSNGTKEGIFKYYNLNNKNNILLPNLIKSSKLSYFSKADRKYQILILGNLIELKGHKYLIQQFVNVIEVFPNLKLLIVGNGMEKSALEKQVKDLNLENDILFKDKVSHAEVNQLFAESLVHISASSHEAFGFVNIEALREGTPIICTRNEGAVEIIKKNINGEFFDREENFSLTNALERILKNWESYSKGALNSFEEKYDLDKNIDQHASLILENCS